MNYEFLNTWDQGGYFLALGQSMFDPPQLDFSSDHCTCSSVRWETDMGDSGTWPGTALHNTALNYFTALYSTALQCTALQCTELHCTALLNSTSLHCTELLHCTLLYYGALKYCTTLNYTTPHWNVTKT